MSSYGFSKGYAQTSYERLILTQPDIEFQGLWEKNDTYYIACRTCETAMVNNGIPLRDWFDKNCRVIGYRVDLLSSPPEGAVRVSPRSPTQLSQLNGSPLNTDEFYFEIRGQLPRDIPSFQIEDAPEAITIVSEYALSPEASQLIRIAIANFGLDIDVIFKSNTTSVNMEEAPYFFMLDSRLKGFSKSAIDAHEASEQLWFDNRLSLFASDHTDASRYITSTNKKQTACFIDCTIGTPGNIRNYLSAYTKIYLSPPFKGLNALLRHLVITERELMMLVEIGRVIVVLQADLHFYNKEVVATLIEAGRGRTILGRQLAAASIAEGRRRNPLMYPPLDNESRRYLLDLLTESSDADSAPSLNAARRYLGSSWASLEMDFSILGSRACFSHGIGNMLREIAHETRGIKLPIEFLMCSVSVEWATALGANYCPTEMQGFDSNSAASLTASFITGIPQGPVIDTASNMDLIVKDLLVLDGDTSIIEILESFSEREIIQLNNILKNCNYDRDSAAEYVSILNKKVKEFDRTQRAVKKRDLLTLAGALAPVLIAGPAATWIPVGAWLGQRILGNETREGNPVTDWLKAKNTFTSSEAVFVSRLRNPQ